MTQYNTLNVKLSNSQLNKLKSGKKNATQVTLNLSSNVIGNSNDETNFPHKLLFTNTQVSRLCKAFANNSSANIKLSQSVGFLGKRLGSLLKTGLSLIKNAVKPLTKSVLKPFGLTTAALATDTGIQNNFFWSGLTTLIISKWRNGWYLEEFDLLKESVSKTIQNEAKWQQREFLGMLLDTLGAILLGNLLTVKELNDQSPLRYLDKE